MRSQYTLFFCFCSCNFFVVGSFREKGTYLQGKSMTQQSSASSILSKYKDQRSRDLASKSPGRLLLQFATPSIIAMSASSIYNLCDSIFIGHGAGPLAIAGLAITFPLMNISSAFGAMMGVGSAAQTSIHMGEGNRRQALMIFGNMLRMDITIGLVITTLGLVFLDPILRAFGASDATLPYARDYMQIILLGNIITHTFLGMNDQLRATGHPRKAMTAQLIAVFANILLDALFIFGFGWGMRGAALATILGQLIAWMFEFHHFCDKSNFVYFSREGLVLKMNIIREIIAIGLSPFCVNVCGCIVVIFLNKALLDQGGAQGDLFVGVYGIVNRIAMLFVMMVNGFSQGLQPIVGFNLGARLYARVRRVLFVAYLSATLLMVFGYGLVFIFAREMSMLFTTDIVMLELSEPALRTVMCMFPIVGGQMITISFFQSIRQAKKAIFLSMTRQMLFLLPLIIFLPRLMGVEGVWWSMPVADFVSAILSIIMLTSQMRKFKQMEQASLGAF